MTTSSRRKFIICLDTALLIIFLLLLSPRLTGLKLHEILGVILFIPLIIHLLLSWRWIKNSLQKFFKTASTRTKFNFFLNTVLFILTITALFSGILISQVVLPYFGIKTIDDSSWRFVHNAPLNFVVLFVGLHIAINWRWVVSVFKKGLSSPKENSKLTSPRIGRIFLRVAILFLAMSVVALLLFSIIGKPSLERLLNQDEIARFAPTFRHGIIQFFGEAALIAVYAFVAWRWLRIRL